MSSWSKHWLMLVHWSSPAILPLHCLISSGTDFTLLQLVADQCDSQVCMVKNDYSLIQDGLLEIFVRSAESFLNIFYVKFIHCIMK